MATSKDLPQDIGEFIRDLRQTAKISLRQLAERAGVSNPYLSQIERGLRKPSAEVLQSLASALRVSTPAMYLRAGLLDSEGSQGVLAAIAVDPELTIAQKQSLSQIYETFRNENARQTRTASAEDAASDEPFVVAGEAVPTAEAAATAEAVLTAEAVAAAETASATDKVPTTEKLPTAESVPAAKTVPTATTVPTADPVTAADAAPSTAGPGEAAVPRTEKSPGPVAAPGE